MITDEKKVELLSAAAMEVYKHFEKGKGFYSGSKFDESTRRRVHVFNSWEAGLQNVLERKMSRRLSKYEQTIVSLAIGRGPTLALTKAERKYSMEYLWGEEYPTNDSGFCQDLMRVLTSF